MKKLNILLVASLMAFCLVACGAKQQVAQSQKAVNPFGETFEAPCTVYDTDEYFAATGIFRGSMEQKGQLQTYALQNAQEQVRLKFQHAYKGMVSDYSSTTGNNQGNDIELKITQAGDQILNMMLNHTNTVCGPKYSGVGDDGRIECYIGIKISKAEIAQKTAAKVANVLSAEEKARIGFNEQQYRQDMEKRFAAYKEGQQ